MIYIKTKMKEMPKGCRGCKYGYTLRECGIPIYCKTGHSNKLIIDEDARPEWCPLVEREEGE